jgi:hypothetical protein
MTNAISAVHKCALFQHWDNSKFSLSPIIATRGDKFKEFSVPNSLAHALFYNIMTGQPYSSYKNMYNFYFTVLTSIITSIKQNVTSTDRLNPD